VHLLLYADALEKWEQHAASESGLMNIILGNTCFTTGAGKQQATRAAPSLLHVQCPRLGCNLQQPLHFSV
jgi:hypothetical protein